MSAESSQHSGSRASSDRVPTTYTIPDPNSVEEHGRTYHGYREGKYYLPNDGEEQDRLDIQHKIWLLMMKGRLYNAPIRNPTNVLDIAAGTGIWAIQLAREHPSATVTGTELSLIQPADSPPNCSFVREDAEDTWEFGLTRGTFDLVHLRAVCSCFADPRAVMQRAYDHLAPGGWCEYDDFAFEQVPADRGPAAAAFVRASSTTRLLEMCVRGLTAAGRDPLAAKKYKRWMEEIGFVDVVEERVLCPVNGWPEDPEERLLGQFMHLDSEKGVPAMVKPLMAAGMRQNEMDGFLAQVKHDFADRNLRAYNIFYIVYGRKPEASPEEAIPDLGLEVDMDVDLVVDEDP